MLAAGLREGRELSVRLSLLRPVPRRPRRLFVVVIREGGAAAPPDLGLEFFELVLSFFIIIVNDLQHKNREMHCTEHKKCSY